MARDINAYIAAEETEARATLEKAFGGLLSFQDIATAAQDLFPPEIRELQALGVFFEGEMIRCRDAKAYFSGCLAAAAMIETFLLLYSFLDKTEVSRTVLFRKLSKPSKTYEEVVLRWTLKELIPVAQELDWIRRSVQPAAVSVLVKLHEELAPAVRPGITSAEIAAGAKYIETHPDLALLHLMQSMRNLVHGGRCVRLRKNLDTPEFAEWAQLVMLMTAEIRDCLILKLKSISQHYLNEELKSAAGQAKLVTLTTSILAKAVASAASQGSGS